MRRPGTVAFASRRRWTAIGAGLVALACLAGCSAETRQRLLPLFFDGVPEAGQPASPPTRRVRQDLQRENEQLRREVADLKAALQARTEAGGRPAVERPAERARTFQEVQSLLPGDSSGQVDWMHALRTGAIHPRPGAGRDADAQAVFDLDVRLARGGHPFFAARFPHASHTAWLACDTCHPALFPIAPGASRAVITMAGIRAGQACGTCHGPVAFNIEGDCVRCHPGIPATSAWQRPEPQAPLERARTWTEVVKLLPETDGELDWEAARTEGLLKLRAGADASAKLEEPTDLDVELVPKQDGEVLKVVFRHASHTAWLTCDTCHPVPFEQEAGTTPITMPAIFKGELCGACHDHVAFPATACIRCHAGLKKAP